MANTSNNDKWYFTKEQLENTPSRKCGYDAHKELSYRQQAANFIQDMGQRLKVSQLCINTAIVYMHRFYVFHSFTHFPWYQMAAAALFLAAKVEEQPRKLEYVIRVANICRNSRDTNIDINSERYIAQSQDLVFNENVLLQTLGFDVAIDHPHTHVVRCCHLVRASKDLAQTSYFMASNSLHLTTMCIQYKPTVVACFCILVACKWSNWEIPLSNEKKEWYSYVDPTVTSELLKQLTEEFLVIFEACPSRLKEKIMAIAENVTHIPTIPSNSPFDTDPKKVNVKEEGKESHHRSHDSKAGSENDPHKHRSARLHEAGSSSSSQRDRDRNRERLAAQQKTLLNNQPKVPGHGHQRLPIDPKKLHSRPPSLGNYQVGSSGSRVEPRDILREAARDSPFGLANKDYRDPSRDVPKRDYLVKPNAQSDVAGLNNYIDSRVGYGMEKQRIDPNKVRIDQSKIPSSQRKYDETKLCIKTETDVDNIKKHLSVGAHDKNSAYLSKPPMTTSKKFKSPPVSVDITKSVPRTILSQANVSHKSQECSESSNGNLFSPPSSTNDIKPKLEPVNIKEETPTPPVIKRPSLFSPEKTPPHKKIVKTEIISPLNSPMNSKRSRNYSSSSEPELRPVIKKIDQIEGFENLMRDSTIGINKINQLPDGSDIKVKTEDCVSDNIPTTGSEPISRTTIINGLETNPTLISNLLKETPAVSHLSSVIPNDSVTVLQPEIKVDKEHHHHKSKKKNKEKHKHKDKSREEREKKKKHKDKDREKHKHKEKREEVVASLPAVPGPIKLKIQLVPETCSSSTTTTTSYPSQGLKVKIPKDKIQTDNLSELSQPNMGIKLKINKEKMNNCNLSSLDGLSVRKRDRDRDHTSPEIPPSKVTKYNTKQNGRYSFNKVTQGGDGTTIPNRLAESKYTHKSSSS